MAPQQAAASYTGVTSWDNAILFHHSKLWEQCNVSIAKAEMLSLAMFCRLAFAQVLQHLCHKQGAKGHSKGNYTI